MTHLVLFFTHGVSLQQWDHMGIFDREVALYHRLREQEIQISFVTYGDNADLEFADRLHSIQVLCNRWKLPPRIYRWVLPILHGRTLKQADIFKSNQTNGANVVLRAARLWRKPMIARCGYMWSDFVERQQGYDSKVAQRVRAVEAKVFAAAQHVFVPAPRMLADVRERIPAASEYTSVLPNFVDTDRFAPSNVKPDVDVTFVGRLTEQKNIASLLEAIRRLDTRVRIIGDGELRAGLQQQFDDISERIIWQGAVPHSDLPGYLSRSKIFILPSHYEGHPKTLIEAMSCGLPVIGTDVPGIQDEIEHERTGLLCNEYSESIYQAIQTMLDNPTLRQQLGIRARKYVLQHYSLDRIVELEQAVIKEIVHS